MTQTMNAYSLHGKEDLRCETRSVPAVKDGHVLVKVRRIGLCGSDIHYFEHGYCGAFIPKRPFVLGHEFSGELVEVGQGVEGFRPSDRIAIDPARTCGQCEFCKSGRSNLCVNVIFFGSASVDPHIDGAFCEYISVSAMNCYRLPDELGFDIAAMLEPLSVAIHAVSRSGSVAGKTIMITGGGTIGQLVLQVVQAYGAAKVIVSDPVETARQTALKQGADLALDSCADDFVERVITFTDGGCDVIFEISGAGVALVQAIHASRRGAILIQVGTLPKEVALPANLIMVKELNLLGSFRFVANTFTAALHLAASGRINLKPLITQTYLFEELIKAMEFACKKNNVIKVQVSAS